MFENVKVGDKVIYHYSGFGGSRSVETITNVTAHFVDARGDRFRKSDGRRPGVRYGGVSIGLWAQEIEDEINQERRILDKRHAVASFFESRANRESLTEAQLDQIIAITKREANDTAK